MLRSVDKLSFAEVEKVRAGLVMRPFLVGIVFGDAKGELQVVVMSGGSGRKGGDAVHKLSFAALEK